MPSATFIDAIDPARLSAVLKTVRRFRNLKAAEVAARMPLAPRSFERFEAGEGRFDFTKVQRFAEVAEVDPYAILFAVLIGSPAFAVRAAQNGISPLILLALEDFDREAGDAIATLDAATILSVFREAFSSLNAEIRRRASLRPGERQPGVSDERNDAPLPAVDAKDED